MNKNIELGVLNKLQINRVTEPGLYLVPDNEDECVLLPNAYITSSMQIDDIIEVFIYTDSEDRIVATTLTPKAKKNEFGFLEVVDTSNFGAFVNWGLPKDLLVPKNKQKVPFKVGEKRLIRIIEDEDSGRLIGVEKITSFLKKDTEHFKQNDEVEILLFAKTPMGFKVIVNNNYEGMIFHNEIFEKIKVGDKKIAYIKVVREDGKLDLALQKVGSKGDDDSLNKVLAMLQKNNGFLPYTSKSNPEIITKIFGLSKKNFKAVLTKLRSEEKIEVEEEGIRLKKS
ncbi:MAG: S1-like domain-containing RNA-binding protein [Arcobacteraceae bacterium]